MEDFIDAVHQLLMPMINRAGGVDAFLGIGMGAPNGNIYTGTIEYAPNLKWKGIIHIARLMQEKIGLPTKLTNDANAAAMGEMLFGCAKDCKHFITITLGTGVGSGIVIDGKIVVGHDGFAGELGHTIIRPGGRLHKSTGMRGSLETYASATGVRDTALEMLQKYPEEDSLLRDFSINELTSKTVYECAIRGDNIANEIFEFTGEILGESLANFVMFSSPEKIVLFGGLTKAGDLLMKPTRKAMEANLLPIFQNKVKLIFSELREADAAILGASALIW
ncbi:MAG TPA: ROK family protein [Ferruginibacter sp.]|nr:ROK family protein [Ferruginibacter sp.]